MMSRNLFGTLVLLIVILVCLFFIKIQEEKRMSKVYQVTVVFNAYENNLNGTYSLTAKQQIAIRKMNLPDNIIDARQIASEEAAENPYISDSIKITDVIVDGENIYPFPSQTDFTILTQ